LVCLLAGLPALAGEEVVLTTGFRLRADRHEVVDGMIRLYTGSATTVFPADAVASVEADDYVPPPPAAQTEPPPVDPRELVTQAAVRNGLPPELLHSVPQVESGYREDAASPKGAVGIMLNILGSFRPSLGQITTAKSTRPAGADPPPRQPDRSRVNSTGQLTY
jgi:hypothetical protein